jgi:transglutaminase-like putative cysteine protease
MRHNAKVLASRANLCHTGAVYETISGYSITLGKLPPGDAGIKKTLEMMQQLSRAGALRREVRETAIEVVRDAGTAPHDSLGELAALFAFVRDRVRFTGDIAGVETLQAPHYTLRVMAGDCDDRAVLLVAMARSIGLPAGLRFRVIGANPSRPGRFSHVYVVANVKGKDVALDPTYPSSKMGWQHPTPSRIGDFPA